jgi:hypothetical protein
MWIRVDKSLIESINDLSSDSRAAWRDRPGDPFADRMNAGRG